MKKIQLNKSEIDLIKSIVEDLNYSLSDFIIKKRDSYIIILIDEDSMDLVRDALIEQLQVCGFDINYKLNEKGDQLERLIDKFYL